MGKLTISMAIFNSYVSHNQRVAGWEILHRSIIEVKIDASDAIQRDAM